jgi:hypothetical protein
MSHRQRIRRLTDLYRSTWAVKIPRESCFS